MRDGRTRRYEHEIEMRDRDIEVARQANRSKELDIELRKLEMGLVLVLRCDRQETSAITQTCHDESAQTARESHINLLRCCCTGDGNTGGQAAGGAAGRRVPSVQGAVEVAKGSGIPREQKERLCSPGRPQA